MKLSKRQQKIVDAIPQCGILADIGCDHGLIGASALKQGICEKVLFCDISGPSLNKAQKLVEEEKISNADFFCQDGIGSLTCDCAVIAGMGGLETISILEKAQTLPQFLVLQPMRNQFDLRRFLCNNYYIESDVIFRDKKFYDLIAARQGQDLQDNLQMLFGKTNLTTPSRDFIDYIQNEIAKCDAILRQADSEIVKRRLLSLHEAVMRMREEI